jgi:hypothetical protein
MNLIGTSVKKCVCLQSSENFPDRFKTYPNRQEHRFLNENICIHVRFRGFFSDESQSPTCKVMRNLRSAKNTSDRFENSFNRQEHRFLVQNIGMHVRFRRLFSSPISSNCECDLARKNSWEPRIYTHVLNEESVFRAIGIVFKTIRSVLR